MWLQLFNRLRQLFAIGLLVVCAYTGWLSLMLLDPGNFRTEGSPAGAGMFVVWMLFPVVSLATGIAGLLLLFLRPSPPPPPPRTWPLPAAPRALVPPSAERIAGSEGSVLELLCQDDLAVLWLRRPDGPGLRSHNAQWRGDADAVAAFRSVDGDALRLPRAWAVSAGLARQAGERFRDGGDWASLLSLRETPPLPADLSGATDRRRWDWLREQVGAQAATAR